MEGMERGARVSGNECIIRLKVVFLVVNITI